MNDTDTIWSALQFIPADSRETWVEAGMAIKSKMGDNGFGIWDEWSRGADNYSETDARDVWRSFKDGSVGIGTLFFLARNCGWNSRSKPSKPIPKPKSAPAPTSVKSNTGVYALELWLRSRDGIATHPYAKAKGIDWDAGAKRVTASGKVIGKNTDCIIVPIRDLQTDKVIAVQCINADGDKQSFGPVSGNAFICGNTLDKSLHWFVCEGWADAVSLVFHHYHGNAVALAACGKGQMKRLATRAAEVYRPEKIHIIPDKEVA